MTLSTRHLTRISDLSLTDIDVLLDLAQYFADEGGNSFIGGLQQYSVSTLFLESSSRTQGSFLHATGRLGIRAVQLNDGTATKKGEHLTDLGHVAASMGVDALIVRCSDQELIDTYAAELPCQIINAGAGATEHPTQALLDLLTLVQEWGSLEALAGKHITFVGDQRYSRVFGSLVPLLHRYDVTISTICPGALVRQSFLDEYQIDNHFALSAEALADTDAIYVLRPQLERGVYDHITENEYAHSYCITMDLITRLTRRPLVLHALPYNRNIDLDPHILYNYDRSLAWKQVNNGVHLRTALLQLLLT